MARGLKLKTEVEDMKSGQMLMNFCYETCFISICFATAIELHLQTVTK